jgi:integral membrane sensor domain MASE1
MAEGKSMQTRRDWREELIWAAGFVAVYVILDWLSWIQPYNGLDITPWNPPPGLILAFLLRRGLRYFPLPFLAALVSEAVVRHFSAPLLPTLSANVIECGGYVLAAWMLRRLWPIDPRLTSLKDVTHLIGVVFVISLITASGFIGSYSLADVIPADDTATVWLRFWIGDMIGVTIFTPLFLTIGQREPNPGLKTKISVPVSIAQGVGILLALWSVFGGDLAQHPQLYYPLFVPLVWVGAWHGLQGVTVALFATQVGMIVAIQEAHLDTEALTEVQFFLLALSLTCLLLGSIVTERRRARLELRDSQLQLKAVVDVSSDGVLTLDELGRVETVNPAFEWLSGRAAAQMLGLPADQLFPSLSKAIGGKGGLCALSRPDGNVFEVEVAVGEAQLSDRKVRIASIRHKD